MGFLKWFAIGLVVGLLSAPRPGSDTRDMLMDKMSGYMGDAVGMAKEKGQQIASQVTSSNGMANDDEIGSEQMNQGGSSI